MFETVGNSDPSTAKFFLYFWIRMDYNEYPAVLGSIKVSHATTFMILMKQSVQTVNKSVLLRISFILHS